MKSFEERKVSYASRLQKQWKLGASYASCLSKLSFFHPILLIVQSFAFQVPGAKAPRFFILHTVKWYQHLFLLFPESPKYKYNTDDGHDDDNDGDCHFWGPCGGKQYWFVCLVLEMVHLPSSTHV